MVKRCAVVVTPTCFFPHPAWEFFQRTLAFFKKALPRRVAELERVAKVRVLAPRLREMRRSPVCVSARETEDNEKKKEGKKRRRKYRRRLSKDSPRSSRRERPQGLWRARDSRKHTGQHAARSASSGGWCRSLGAVHGALVFSSFFFLI